MKQIYYTKSNSELTKYNFAFCEIEDFNAITPMQNVVFEDGKTATVPTNEVHGYIQRCVGCKYFPKCMIPEFTDEIFKHLKKETPKAYYKVYDYHSNHFAQYGEDEAEHVRRMGLKIEKVG